MYVYQHVTLNGMLVHSTLYKRLSLYILHTIILCVVGKSCCNYNIVCNVLLHSHLHVTAYIVSLALECIDWY